MKDRTNQRGAVLGMVLIVLLVVSTLGLGFSSLSRTDAVETAHLYTAQQAFWTAEAGLAHLRAIVNKRREPFNVMGVYGPNALSGSTGTGTYNVGIEENLVGGATPIRRYTITSRGTCGSGETRQVRARAEIRTFASYMHATEHEETPSGQNIYFATGDVLDGMVYVNDQLNIYGQPRFLQRASSAASSVNYRSGGDSSVFEGGLQLNAQPLDFNEHSDHVDALRTIAQQGGLSLNGDHNISFLSDGSVTYQRASGGAVTTNSLSSFNGAIYVNGDVHLRPPAGESTSVVNGNVTVAAHDTVYIQGSVTYDSAAGYDVFNQAFDPVPYLDDHLGLVGRDGVLVGRGVASGQPVTVHAAVLTTEGDDGFGAERRYELMGTPSINLFGSIGQFRRGVVGRADGRGYRKHYRYDTRFLTDPPSHFPYSNYAFSNWSQEL